jgi:hypothetical protein
MRGQVTVGAIMKQKLLDMLGTFFMICLVIGFLYCIGISVYESRESIEAFFFGTVLWSVLFFLPVGGLASDILESKNRGKTLTDTAKRFLSKIALIVISVACAFTLMEMSLGVRFAAGVFAGAYLTTAALWIFCLKPRAE